MAGNGPLTFIKKAWLPLLIVVVVTVAGIIVARTRTFFGADGVTVTPRNFADDPEPFDPKVVNPNQLISGISDFFRRTVGETIELEIFAAQGLWNTETDPNQLEAARR